MTAASAEAARDALTEYLHQRRQARQQFAPRDLKTLAAQLGKGRGWVMHELRRLVDTGELATADGYYQAHDLPTPAQRTATDRPAPHTRHHPKGHPMTAPTLPATPTVTIGTDPTGTPVTIPTGGILITGDHGTGKTYVAARIAAARTLPPAPSVLWAVHETARTWTHPLAEYADWSATRRSQAAGMLDTAHALVHAARRTPDAARVLLAIDADYLLPEGWTKHATGLAAAGPDHGLDLLLIPGRLDLAYLPDALTSLLPTRIAFRQRNPYQADRAADLLGLDTPDLLHHLPTGTAYVQHPGAGPVLVTIPR